MPYTDTSTLLLGGIPARSEVEMAAFVTDAADEMDSMLGTVYEVPISKNGAGLPLEDRSPALLTLARINRFLASGRYIMAVAASGEDSALHAYGLSLVRDAKEALAGIVSKKVMFDVVELPDPDTANTAPMISNAEARSNVDAFYGAYTGSDGMMFGTPWPYGLGRLESE